MSFILEAALSTIFEALFSKFTSYFNLVSYEQVQEEIEKWDKNLKRIYAMLDDVEGQQMHNRTLEIWLADLRELAYDVDDILDEFTTKEYHDQASTSKGRRLTLVSTFDRIPYMVNNETMSKMSEITARLENLEAQKSKFQLTHQNGGKRVIPKLPESSSVVDETPIYGRQKDKEVILRMLRSNDKNFSVIPIVGMGGIGKTTLAQFVYNDDSIKDHFDLKEWVCVSDEFDIVHITKKLVSSQSCDEDDLDSLQVKLKGKLSGKKFLLVLDDVWNENYEDWMRLRYPFDVGAPGSKIIVTTRSFNVSSIMETVPAHLLQKLSDDDSLRLFAHHALGGSDFSVHSELKGIGLVIMKKCDGLPLATKTVGGLLRTKLNREAWKDILESKIWKLAEDKSYIIPALWLSYYHLPSQLKQCFAYCSLIPKDYEFEKEEIIPLWMAEGFLNEENTKSSKEDLGRKCFEELISRSFFQATTKEKSKFVMHDLINDLAQSVAQEFYFRLEEHQKMKISRRTRHLSDTVSRYNGFQKFQDVYEAEQLRTFLSFGSPVDGPFYLSQNVVIDVISKLRYLRIISLKRYEIYEIPDSIGNLKHLRFLDFSYTKIKRLPDSVCNLYNLETLKLRGCENITQLSLKMLNLVNLCHLDISGACSIRELPSGIGKLTNLQVLSNFIVGQGDAANIREMQDLFDLKGKISISGLQNVNEARDAFEAKMSYKTGLSDLKLEWCEDFDENLRKKEAEIDVLSFLKPHEELKSLSISYYAGLTFPIWIAVPSFEKLQSLTLEGCRNCKSLPAVGKLPLLKDLCIKGMNVVPSVGNEFYGENPTNAFPSLKSLCFEDMPEWKEWKLCEVGEQGKIFHCLRKLHIRNCPKLVELFPVNGFCSLKELQIYKCKELEVSISTLPKLHAVKIDGCKEVMFGSYSDICSVKEVVLSNISKLACESQETVMSESMKVESLNVNACWWHTKWEWLAPLESLSDLKIIECSEVVSVGATKLKEEENEEHLQLNVPCNIGRMRIEDCEGFEKISKSFQNLRSLSRLEIINCGKLVSVETNSLPPTLKHLVIRRCENVQCLLDDGEDMNFSSTSLLQSLTVKECKALQRLSSSGKLPLCLKSLDILHCSELEFVVEEIRDEACLKSIRIWGCKKIKYLPQGLDKLSSLHSICFLGCPELECSPESGWPAYTNLKLYSLLQLQDLTILGCPRLKTMFSEGSFGLPTNLTVLNVDGPEMIKAVMEGGVDRLTSLKNLIIHGDSNSFAQEKDEIEMKLPTSLTRLSISDFKNIKKISSNTFQNLTSLQTLLFFRCLKLKSLPKKEMLLSLLRLYIDRCPELKKRCERDKGELWPNIAHIPRIEIDDKNIYECSSGRTTDS